MLSPDNLRVYAQDRRCQKCGGRPRDVFVAAEERNPRGFFEERYTMPVINRACSNCHFWWVELPLDTKEQKPNDNETN